MDQLRDQLLALDDLRTKEVTVPVWKHKLTIRELGLQESLEWAGPDRVSKDGKVTLSGEDLAKVIAYGVINPETGERVFTNADIPKLASKNRRALMFLYNEITALSGSVEDAEKN